MHSTTLALTNMYPSNLISDAMVSNSSRNTSAPTANGGNPLPRQQTSLLASVMQIPLKKGQKVKEADPATLQSGITETGFSKGGEILLSIELQGCLALIFIRFSPMFPFLLEKMAYMAWKYYSPNRLLAHTDTWIQKAHFCQVHLKKKFQNQDVLFFHFRKKITKRAKVITFKALIVQRGKGNDWSGKLNLREPLCTQRPSRGHFLLGGLRAPFLLMEGKQNRWDTNCTFIHLKVQGNFPSAPVKFSDCLSILWAFHSSKGFGFVQCPDSYTHTH